MEEKLYQLASRLTPRHKLFSRDLPLTPQHFAILPQDKNVKQCLAFLVRHVVPPDQARLINLNLQHAAIKKSVKEEGEEVESLREYMRLKAAIVEARTAITADTNDLLRINHQKEEVRQGVVESRRKACEVRAAREAWQHHTQHYHLWTTQLTQLQHNNRLTDHATNKPSLAVKNKLHTDLLELERIHHAILSSQPADSQSLHQVKEGVWESIGDSFEEWKPQVMVEAVITQTRESQHRVRSLLHSLDLARDAQELRVKCESAGTFMGESNPCGVLESVEELVRQLSATHVRLHLQAHQENQAAVSLTRAFNTLTNNITTLAKRNHQDEEMARAVVTLLKTTCGLSGERAALSSAQDLTATLQDKADKATQLALTLKDKHININKYEKDIQDKVHNIQSVAANIQGRRDTVKDVLNDLQSNMRTLLSLTTTPTPTSTSLAQECDRLHTLPLAHLLTTHLETSGERKQKVCLSTTPLVWHSPEVAAAGSKVTEQLCHGVRCWDGVYEAACKHLQHTTSLHRQMEHLTSLHQELGIARKQAEAISRQAAKELTQRVERHDKKVEEQVTEMVKDTETQVTQGLHLVNRFTQHMADWWEQPAQKIQVKPLK